MSKIKIKLKPFKAVVKEFVYYRDPNSRKIWKSKKCVTQINDEMLHFFDNEIVVEYHEDKLYRYDFWIINDMWVERDEFKISEINNLFDIILEEI